MLKIPNYSNLNETSWVLASLQFIIIRFQGYLRLENLDRKILIWQFYLSRYYEFIHIKWFSNRNRLLGRKPRPTNNLWYRYWKFYLTIEIAFNTLFAKKMCYYREQKKRKILKKEPVQKPSWDSMKLPAIINRIIYLYNLINLESQEIWSLKLHIYKLYIAQDELYVPNPVV